MFNVNMPTLKGVPIICTQKMAEEALKSGHAKFSVEPTLKTQFPLQFTEWKHKTHAHISPSLL